MSINLVSLYLSISRISSYESVQVNMLIFRKWDFAIWLGFLASSTRLASFRASIILLERFHQCPFHSSSPKYICTTIAGLHIVFNSLRYFRFFRPSRQSKKRTQNTKCLAIFAVWTFTSPKPFYRWLFFAELCFSFPKITSTVRC